MEDYNKITNTTQSLSNLDINNLLNNCDHQEEVDKILYSENYIDLFKYTNFSRKYIKSSIFGFILHGNIKALKHFINHYEDLSYTENDGWQLIHYFCNLNSELVPYLLNKNIKLDTITCGGNSPIKLISEDGSFEIIQLFINKGIKPDTECVFNINNNMNLTYNQKIILLKNI